MIDTVLITGGSSGVGKSLVEYLSEEYQVVTVARRIERLEKIFGNNDSVYTHQLDLEKVSDVRGQILELNSRYGPILSLINNAAINQSGPIGDIEPEEIETSIKVNTIAPIEVIQSLLPVMKEYNYGRIINITSGAPLDLPECTIPYSSSKAALNIATVTAAAELNDYNIKINLMSPGPTQSEMAPNAPLSPTACHPTIEYLLKLNEDGPTGRFYWLGNEVPLFPELGDVDWESGEPSEYMKQVVDDE